MSQSDSNNSDTPKRRFELEVEDNDTKAAFSKGDKDAKRDKKPPMESSVQGEGNNFPLEIHFDSNFLPSLPASKVK